MAELASTGAGEHKAQLRTLLQQGMHHIQQLRSLLDFVDHHGVGLGCACDALPKAFGPGLVGTQHIRSQQIQPQRSGEHLGKPGGLARTPRPEKEETTERKL